MVKSGQQNLKLFPMELVDRLKGVGIILVVLGHVIQMAYLPKSFDESLLFGVIYSFHMALFFFLSGTVYKEKAFFKEFSAVFKRLLVPFVIFYFIVSCNFDIHHFIKNIGRYFLDPQMGFWFFITLAIIRLGVNSWFLIHQNILKLAYIVIFLGIAFLLKKKLSMDYVIFYTPFFLAGIYIKKINLKIIGKNLSLIAACAAYWVIYLKFHQRNILDMNIILFLFQKTVLAALGVFICINLVSRFDFSSINKTLDLIGKKTLFIYGLHLLFLPFFYYIGFWCIVPMIFFPVLIDLMFNRIKHQLKFL